MSRLCRHNIQLPFTYLSDGFILKLAKILKTKAAGTRTKHEKKQLKYAMAMTGCFAKAARPCYDQATGWDSHSSQHESAAAAAAVAAAAAANDAAAASMTAEPAVVAQQNNW